MADKNAGKLARLVHHYGLRTRTNGTCPQLRYKTGEADTLAYRNGIAIEVECKQHKTAWDTKKWTPEQRQYAKRITGHPTYMPFYIFMTMGDRVNSKDKPQKSWLIPYHFFRFCIEEIIEPIQKTLPYKLNSNRKHKLKVEFSGTLDVFDIQLGGIRSQPYHFTCRDAVTLFKTYELMWHPAKTVNRPPFFATLPGAPYTSGLYLPRLGHPILEDISKGNHRRDYARFASAS